MSYNEALNKAIGYANLTKREAGVGKLGPNQFYAMMLPNKGNRFGSELTCEIVEPGRVVEMEVSR